MCQLVSQSWKILSMKNAQLCLKHRLFIEFDFFVTHEEFSVSQSPDLNPIEKLCMRARRPTVTEVTEVLSRKMCKY